MATRHGRSRHFARLRCDTLEPRVTPASAPVLDFAAGFTEDRLPGGLPAGYADGDLLLTDGPFQATAVWAPTRVDLRAFQTSFVFRLGGEPGRLGDGFTFALAGTPAGAGAAGGGLGYQGLADSVAIKFDLVDNAGEGTDSVGVFTGGAEPTAPAVTLDGTPIRLHSQHPMRADVGYDGATRTLTLALTDTTAPGSTWTHQFVVDVPAAVGSPTGYAGFTAGTGELFARQSIDSWTFAEGPPGVVGNRPPEIVAPAAASWLGPAGVALGAGATDDGGPGNLTYTWETVAAPPGASPPRITLQPHAPLPGATALGLDATVSLGVGGRYTFRVTVRDAQGLTATSEVRYVDPTSVSSFEVSPAGATVPAGGTIQFQTLVPDAAGNPTPERIATSWAVVSGRGTIDGLGRYTAPTDASGPVTVRATVPAFVNQYFTWHTADATVTVVPTQRPAGPVNFGGGFAGAGLSQNGSARVDGDRLRLADGPFQAGSAYGPGPVDVRGFTTSFRFRVGDAPSWWHGDGLTFVLQNAGPAAVGAAGGGLGYAGIGKSVAVKFDLVDNAGEGTDSVGVFAGGAEPTTPADRLPPGQDGAIHLNSGHVFRADLAYADGTLVLDLWDTETGAGFRRSYPMDVPAAVGGPTAYAGFTAGTGSLAAPIDVLDWTYAPAGDWGPGPTDGGDGSPSLAVHVGVGAGVITTVAGTGLTDYSGHAAAGGPATGVPLNLPQGVAVDAAGNLFIADSSGQRIRRVDAATGLMTTVAGIGTAGYGGDGGPATSAAVWNPRAVALDAAGNLFFSDDGNSRIRRVDALTGVITTVAGNGTAGYGGDGGPATSASLDYAFGVAVDPAGNVFIADRNNNRVRKVDAGTGIITTVAGTGAQGYGGDGGPATSANLYLPAGVAVDAAGNLFIGDAFNDRVRRVDAATGVITTVAGNGTSGYGGDGGPATAAAIDYPFGMTVDAAGNLFFADNGNHRVRRVDALTGVITTVAGTGTAVYGGDGGPATSAALDYPTAVAVDAAGNVFVADTFNNRVRRVAGAVREGDPVTYTFTITNTSPAGTDPVTVTSVADTVLGDLTAAAVAAHGGGPLVLAPGESLTLNDTTGPLNAGATTGTVTVTGHDDEGLPATASDSWTVAVG